MPMPKPPLPARLRAVIAALASIFATTSPGLAQPVVDMGAFRIDRTEVTVAAFRAHAEATGLRTRAERMGGGYEWDGGWQQRAGWTYLRPQGRPAAADEPAVHLTWAEARDYCTARGGRLPRRNEWALAAYTETRPNPPEGLRQGQVYRYPVGDDPAGMNNNRRGHVPVGTTRAGVNGLYDMGGNVWEWLEDRQAAQALTAGGSWWYGPAQTQASGMQWKAADFTAVYIGFRCAYD